MRIRPRSSAPLTARPVLVVAASATLALTAACGEESATVQSGSTGDADVTGNDLQGRSFSSSDVTEGEQSRDLAGDTAISLRFTEDGRLVADGGCNTMSGPVDLDDGELAVRELATTEMACHEALQRQDEWLGELLRDAPSWELDGAELRVDRGGTTIALVDDDAASTDLPLRRTAWTVTSLLGDDGPAASQSEQTSQASLRIIGDEVKAHGGCNGLGGPAEVDEAANPPRITVGPLVGTKMACEDAVMKVENHLAQVLDGEVTATIEGDTLRLVNENGLGMVLTGEPPEDAGDDAGNQGGPTAQ